MMRQSPSRKPTASLLLTSLALASFAGCDKGSAGSTSPVTTPTVTWSEINNNKALFDYCGKIVSFQAKVDVKSSEEMDRPPGQHGTPEAYGYRHSIIISDPDSDAGKTFMLEVTSDIDQPKIVPGLYDFKVRILDSLNPETATPFTLVSYVAVPAPKVRPKTGLDDPHLIWLGPGRG